MNHLSIAAVASGGLAAVSPSPAQSWTATAAPNTNWSCIACSADGSTIVAGTDYGLVYFSGDAGATWKAAGMPDGHWSSVASSADGCKLMAAASGGTSYLPPRQGGIFTLQFTPTPVLAIARSGGSTVLSWTIPSVNLA